MIHLFVHLYIHKNQESNFHQYETAALTIWRKHGGQLISANRPNPNQSTTLHPPPYEIHHLTIPNQAAFAAFRANPQQQNLAPLRQKCIAQTEIFWTDPIEY